MAVLVTGSSGRIGSDVVDLADPSQLSIRQGDLVDRRPMLAQPFVHLDVTDPASCRAACAGVEAVLHLAADPSPAADFRTTVMPLNMGGTYNMVEAAVDAGVSRFVFASSVQAVEGYPPDHQVREEDPPRPANDYGVGKAFGEALCAAAAVAHADTTFVSVRIGNYTQQRPGSEAAWRDRTSWLSPADGVQLLMLALTAPLGGHAVVHGVSNNATKRLSIERTRRLVGFAPTDDAFASRP